MAYGGDSTRQDPIVLVEHDLRWKEAFDTAAGTLDTVLHGLLLRPIEHVGSTSVVGLPAKPIIDMAAVVNDLDLVLQREDALADADWVPSHPEAGDRRRLGYCTPSTEHRTHHLHVVPDDDPLWSELITFRDLLRTDTAARIRYADVKRSLIERARLSRDEYRSAKGPVIRSLLGGLGPNVSPVAERVRART